MYNMTFFCQFIFKFEHLLSGEQEYEGLSTKIFHFYPIKEELETTKQNQKKLNLFK